jgi:hypothetical protein
MCVFEDAIVAYDAGILLRMEGCKHRQEHVQRQDLPREKVCMQMCAVDGIVVDVDGDDENDDEDDDITF